MAARTRASLPDDDSLGEHLPLEMVRIDVPQITATPTIQVEPDETIALDESAGTLGSSGLVQTDFLNNTNNTLLEGVTGEYEVPNLFTYKKVSQSLFNGREGLGCFRLRNYSNECKMRIQVSQSNR